MEKITDWKSCTSTLTAKSIKPDEEKIKSLLKASKMNNKILVFGLIIALLPCANAAGNTNISILYGYNGTTYVPLLTDGAGHLQTVMNLTSIAGLNPITNNTYDLGATDLLWANLYARSVRGSSGTLSLFGGTTEAMTILGGNVGIGTTSPVSKLDVRGTTTITDSGTVNITLRGNGAGEGEITTSTNHPLALGANSQVNLLIQNGTGNIGIGTTSPTSTLTINSSLGAGALNIINTSNGASTFFVNTSSGNVGIGTTGPGMKLDVQGTQGVPATSGSTATGILRLRNSNSNVLDFGNIEATGAAWIQATYAPNLATVYDLALNPNGGNVGIGTTSPSQKLEITGSGTYVGILINNSAGNNGWALYAGNNSHPTLPSDFGIYDTTGDLYRLVIQNGTGNVGIGTTGPLATLHVAKDQSRSVLTGLDLGIFFLNAGIDHTAGDVTAMTFTDNGGSEPAAIIGNQLSGNGGNLFFGTSNNFATGITNTAMYINYNGNVGIGTTNPGQTLVVVGSANITGAIYTNGTTAGVTATVDPTACGNMRFINGVYTGCS